MIMQDYANPLTLQGRLMIMELIFMKKLWTTVQV